jgi:ribose 5-phosphate isomerase A
MIDIAAEKRAVGRAAAAVVEDGMRVGLGTGTTVAELIPALADRRLAITCVATSPATEASARSHGLDVVPFDDLDRLDLTIDGADQVDPVGWLVKGGGGAHTRERIVAAAADRFVVIVSSDKPVARLHARFPSNSLPSAWPRPCAGWSLPWCVTRRAPPTPACWPTTAARSTSRPGWPPS